VARTKHSDEIFVDAYKRHGGDVTELCSELKVDRQGAVQRIARMQRDGRLEKGKATHISPLAELKITKDRLKNLEAQLLTDEYVRERIIKLVGGEPRIPEWTRKAVGKVSDLAGVPTLFCSDWHWGEVVRPSEIGGVNEYNLKIAHKRAETLFTVASDLLMNHLTANNYPGICLILGGDMISGDIHDELRESNEEPTMVVWLDLLGVLEKSIKTLRNNFGNVFIVGVTGNHGRNTHKPRAKRRNHSNFDWLLYQVLKLRFQDDPHVTFLIPDGSDALFKLYETRYCLTHGDQFRGGDGIIGPLGPITRGDIKKRSRQSQVHAGYDTLLMGHWHQYIQLHSLIVNGSLKGYDEYAAANNFKFESPRQALWITHPEHGITFSMPVYVERLAKEKSAAEWAAVPA
jgi:hypothetical protein